MYHSQIMDPVRGAVARRAQAAVFANETESLRFAHKRLSRIESRAAVWDKAPLGIRRRAYWTHQAIFGQKKWIDFWSPNSTVLITDEHQNDPHDLAFRVNCDVIGVSGEPCPVPCAAPYEPEGGWSRLECTSTAEICLCIFDFCYLVCECELFGCPPTAPELLGDNVKEAVIMDRMDQLIATGYWTRGVNKAGRSVIRPTWAENRQQAIAAMKAKMEEPLAEPELVQAKTRKGGGCCNDDAPITRRAVQSQAKGDVAPLVTPTYGDCEGYMVCITVDLTIDCALPSDVVRANPTDWVQQCVTIDGDRTCIATPYRLCTDEVCGQGPLTLDCPPDSEPNP